MLCESLITGNERNAAGLGREMELKRVRVVKILSEAYDKLIPPTIPPLPGPSELPKPGQPRTK